MKKDKMYVYAEEKIGNTVFAQVLPVEYPISSKMRSYSEEVLIEKYNSHFTEEKLRSDLKRMLGSSYDIDKMFNIKMVLATKGAWKYGEYYAHEYDMYTEGRRREIKYSNGHKEYLVECLDKSLAVMDGIWDEPQDNGCGDHFYA